MPRSATTALYTRVDNSFSNPVVGTTISPTDADTFFDDVESAVNAFVATSSSSVAIGTGAKTFTVASDVAGKAFLAGTFVHIWSRADVADYMFGSVTSYSTSTGELVVEVTVTGGSGTNTDWNIMQAGARGAPGTTGATGPASGVNYNYSTTTADADPGAGIFRLNHATVASATAGYFDNDDSDGNTVTAWLDSFDDSTTTGKGTLVLRGITTPAALAIFSVTGSVVDGTGYRKLTLTYVAGGGTFTNGESFAVNFIRTGDKGDDGAGVGDVTAASSFGTDNILIKSDGTGKGVQSTGIAVDDSNNVSGVGTLGCGAITSTGAFSIGTSNAATVGSIELGHASANTLTASSGTLSIEGVAVLTTATGIAQGKHSIEIPAGAMKPGTTSGAASATVEASTNDQTYPVLDFDASSDEYANFNFTFPKSWDEGTITFSVTWTTTASDSDGVAWALQAVAVGDGDTIDASWGTAVVVTDDAQSAAGDVLVTAESGAVTIGGTPTVGKRVFFRVFRDVSDANDDMTEDARLIGVTLYYTVNASTDA